VGLNFRISRFVKQQFFDRDFSSADAYYNKREECALKRKIHFFLLIGRSFGACFRLSLSQYPFTEMHKLHLVENTGDEKWALRLSILQGIALFKETK